MLIVADAVQLPLTYGGLRLDVYCLILAVVTLSCLGTGLLVSPRLHRPRAPKGRRGASPTTPSRKEIQP